MVSFRRPRQDDRWDQPDYDEQPQYETPGHDDEQPLPDAMLVPPPTPLHVLAAIRRFRPYMSGLWGRLFAGIVLQLIDLLSTVVTIALFAYIVDNVLVTGDMGRLYQPMLAWIGVTIPGSVASHFGEVTTGVVAERMVTACATTCTNGLSSWLHVRRKYPSGDLIARHSSDVEATEHLVSSAVVSASLAALSVIVYAVAALLAQWELALIAFVLAPILALVSRWFGLVLKRVSRRERIANGTISALVAEGSTIRWPSLPTTRGRPTGVGCGRSHWSGCGRVSPSSRPASFTARPSDWSSCS